MKSIDRLREYVTGPARCGISLICEKIILKELDSIEREVGEMQRALTIDTQPMTDENMAEHGWVRLPVDAEGVPIHVGDVMEERSGHTFEVASIMVFGGSGNQLVFSDARNFSSFREPHDLRHHHAPTVEDVLREFALACEDAGNAGPEVERIVAEYAAKLRLAEEDE